MSSQDHASIKNLEMGYTPAEFIKTLQGQFINNNPYTCNQLDENIWQIVFGEDAGEASVNVQVTPTRPRKIATLILPVLNVRFEFFHANTQQIDDFLGTFLRYFHKGGG
jgi:hypothetical protein